jgi:hypothetical protein
MWLSKRIGWELQARIHDTQDLDCPCHCATPGNQSHEGLFYRVDNFLLQVQQKIVHAHRAAVG